MQAFSSGLLEGKRILITGGGSGLGRGSPGTWSTTVPSYTCGAAGRAC